MSFDIVNVPDEVGRQLKTVWWLRGKEYATIDSCVELNRIVAYTE